MWCNINAITSHDLHVNTTKLKLLNSNCINFISSNYSIIEIVTVSPIGLTKSTLAMYGEQQWFVNVTWTPTQDQSAPNIFCFSAMDSIGSVAYF